MGFMDGQGFSQIGSKGTIIGLLVLSDYCVLFNLFIVALLMFSIAFDLLKVFKV